jgi:hypothetical protein
MDPAAHFGNRWPSVFRGRKLTDRAITKWAKKGFYGDVAKKAAFVKKKSRRQRERDERIEEFA